MHAHTLSHSDNNLHNHLQRYHLDGRCINQLDMNQLSSTAKKSLFFQTVSFFPGMKHDLVSFQQQKAGHTRHTQGSICCHARQSISLLWHCPMFQSNSQTEKSKPHNPPLASSVISSLEQVLSRTKSPEFAAIYSRSLAKSYLPFRTEKTSKIKPVSSYIVSTEIPPCF